MLTFTLRFRLKPYSCERARHKSGAAEHIFLGPRETRQTQTRTQNMPASRALSRTRRRERGTEQRRYIYIYMHIQPVCIRRSSVHNYYHYLIGPTGAFAVLRVWYLLDVCAVCILCVFLYARCSAAATVLVIRATTTTTTSGIHSGTTNPIQVHT